MTEPTGSGASDEPMTEDRCMACNKTFALNAKPQWVFDHDLNLIGKIHTGCLANSHPGLRGWLTMRADWAKWDLEIARFYAWLFTRPVEKDPDGDRECARMLAFSDDEQQQFDHWVHGPLQMNSDRIPAIKAAYQELIEEYRTLGRRVGWLKEKEPSVGERGGG